MSLLVLHHITGMLDRYFIISCVVMLPIQRILNMGERNQRSDSTSENARAGQPFFDSVNSVGCASFPQPKPSNNQYMVKENTKSLYGKHTICSIVYDRILYHIRNLRTHQNQKPPQLIEYIFNFKKTNTFCHFEDTFSGVHPPGCCIHTNRVKNKNTICTKSDKSNPEK